MTNKRNEANCAGIPSAKTARKRELKRSAKQVTKNSGKKK